MTSLRGRRQPKGPVSGVEERVISEEAIRRRTFAQPRAASTAAATPTTAPTTTKPHPGRRRLRTNSDGLQHSASRPRMIAKRADVDDVRTALHYERQRAVRRRPGCGHASRAPAWSRSWRSGCPGSTTSMSSEMRASAASARRTAGGWRGSRRPAPRRSVPLAQRAALQAGRRRPQKPVPAPCRGDASTVGVGTASGDHGSDQILTG